MSPTLLHRTIVARKTQRMGFPHLAAAMTELVRREMNLGARTAHSGQAATSRGILGAAAAVNDNASEVLAAGVHPVFPPMNTVNPPPALAGIFARRVSEITGLSTLELDRLHTDDMGSPGHYVFLPGTGGGMFYTPAGLSRLVEILHAEGRKPAAVCLAGALDDIRPRRPAPVAPAGRNVRGSWIADWEAAQS